MTGKWHLLLTLLLSLGLLLTACGGGGDDDDDSGGTGDDDDDDNDDNDAADDDDDNDDNDDDNDDNDTTDDDDDDDNDDNDDTEVQYDPVTCPLPDPAGLGDGVTVGGGAITDTITAYVYDDATCATLANGTAFVNGVPTDADGKVVLTVAKAAALVVATAPDHWGWAYKLDANTMYFRLQGGYTGSWVDSAAGHFKSGGSNLALDNPSGSYNLFNLGNLLNAPIYLGAAIPGISRKTVLSTDFDHLMPEATFPLTYEYQLIGEDPDGDTIDMPSAIYFPPLDIDLNLVGLVTAAANASNDQYIVPVNGDWDENPVEGFVASATISEALSADALIALITTLIGGGDIMEAIIPLIPAVLNDALIFEYQGVNPAWNGTGAPDLNTVDIVTAKETVNFTVQNPDADYDYLVLVAGEIPNRALWPIGLKIASAGGTASVAAAPVDNADYLAVVIKTDVLTVLSEGGDTFSLNFALKFAEDLSDWSGGVTVDDNADFLPLFADTTEYTAGGVINWSLSEKAAVDAYVAIVIAGDGTVGITLLPGTENTFDAATAFGYTPNTGADDIVFLAGVDFPADVDINEFDPTSLLTYNSAALNIWTNYDLSTIIPSN